MQHQVWLKEMFINFIVTRHKRNVINPLVPALILRFHAIVPFLGTLGTNGLMCTSSTSFYILTVRLYTEAPAFYTISKHIFISKTSEPCQIYFHSRHSNYARLTAVFHARLDVRRLISTNPSRPCSVRNGSCCVFRLRQECFKHTVLVR